MHILFLSDNFPPESNAPASRTFEHTREWVALGHQVTVITCAPNFPGGKVFGGYRNKLWQSEVMDGIKVIRVWSYIAKNEGFTKRILDYLSYMVAGFFAALFVRRVDVVVGTSPQLFTTCAAWTTAAVKRRPFVFELRDIWPESIRAVSAMKNARILDFFECVELFLYRRASVVISVTHSFKRNLVNRGIVAEKTHVVTNGVDAARFSPMPKDPELVNELGLSGKFVAGYIGTHGLAHALDTLLDAAAILARDPAMADFRLLFLGDGASRSALIARSGELGLKNVVFLPSVPKHDVARYWSLLDVSIIHLKKTDLFKTVIPSKLFECMAMGIPILHGVEGESADILRASSTGLTVEPENAEDLAAKICTMWADPKMRAKFAAHGPKAARKYDRRKLAQDMLELLVAQSR